MQRWVDHVLCSLPFEEPWYRERGVAAEYVGHPFFDELPRQRLDADFMESQQRQGRTIIGLLPGSRTQEVERNFLSQLRTADAIHRARPETRFLVASFKESQQRIAERMRRDFPHLPVQMFVGKTPEIIKACVSVSGSVSLELLYRAKPTVILYRLGPLLKTFLKPLVKTKYITLVNLLADKALYPEFASVQCQAPAISEKVLHWLNDDTAYAKLCRELVDLRDRCARPGACARAAQQIVEALPRRRLNAA
jgi:lipid-A-disaccharide synthase